MRELNITLKVQVYTEPSQLSESEQQLLMEARAALYKAYAPYSKFKVGAALLLSNNQIISGANQENAAYPMCLCAEQVALSAAASTYPGIPIVAMAIVVESENHVIDQPAAPCGACRQVISETEDRHGHNIAILLQGAQGDIFKVESGKQLLPLSFNASFL